MSSNAAAAAAARKKLELEKIKLTYNTSPGYFGFPLDHEAPIVLCDCIGFIRNRGMYDVGVFRIPGNQDRVNELKKKYNDAFCSKEDKEENADTILNTHKPAPTVNDVASLMKAYFKDLPEPVIPMDATREMVEIVKAGYDSAQEIAELSKVIKGIKNPNKRCLGFLISFLREIATFKKFNQMNAENLSTCFVLSLMGGSDPFDQLLVIGQGAVIIKKLISCDIALPMPSLSAVKKNTRYKEISKMEIDAEKELQREEEQAKTHLNMNSKLSSIDKASAIKSNGKDLFPVSPPPSTNPVTVPPPGFGSNNPSSTPKANKEQSPPMPPRIAAPPGMTAPPPMPVRGRTQIPRQGGFPGNEKQVGTTDKNLPVAGKTGTFNSNWGGSDPGGLLSSPTNLGASNGALASNTEFETSGPLPPVPPQRQKTRNKKKKRANKKEIQLSPTGVNDSFDQLPAPSPTYLKRKQNDF